MLIESTTLSSSLSLVQRRERECSTERGEGEALERTKKMSDMDAVPQGDLAASTDAEIVYLFALARPVVLLLFAACFG